MANPQEGVYKQYLNYDWDSFDEFQQGLSEILDNHLETLKEQDSSIVSIPALDKQQLTNQAKVFFFCNKTGEILNLEDYEDWKLHNGDKYIKSKQVEEVQEDSSAPYTSNYQNVVELIMSGKPVPGIKQIPDTVLSGQGSTASQSQRVKPWEKN